jgi:hypothetical protein
MGLRTKSTRNAKDWSDVYGNTLKLFGEEDCWLQVGIKLKDDAKTIPVKHRREDVLDNFWQEDDQLSI